MGFQKIIPYKNPRHGAPGSIGSSTSKRTISHCHIQNIKAVGLVVSEKKIFLVFPIVSLWDLSVAMETTILIQSAPKPNAINPPTQLWFTLNLIKIGLLASEIFFFEIVDGRRRTTDDDDGRRMPAYPISSPVSLRLR